MIFTGIKDYGHFDVNLCGPQRVKNYPQWRGGTNLEKVITKNLETFSNWDETKRDVSIKPKPFTIAQQKTTSMLMWGWLDKM